VSEPVDHRIEVHLDKLLAARGVTLVELSAQVGVSVANLSILKNGHARAIRFSTLTAICDALECHPGQLLSLHTSFHPTPPHPIPRRNTPPGRRRPTVPGAKRRISQVPRAGRTGILHVVCSHRVGIQPTRDAPPWEDTLRGEGPFTVFAPTDDAFAALPTGTLAKLLADPTGDLKDILTYHVVPGAVPAADVVTLDGQKVTTVNGAAITIGVTDNGSVTLTDATGHEAAVVQTDIEAKNGVIHVIDAVLLPA
jgi:DNA-binding Xre family transcriptional regulator